MNLKCKINGIEYDIVQGNSFAEEYNETLDSGSIIISHIGQIADLYPYDDVFIYTGEFKGYPFSSSNPKPDFYKHLLVDQFTEEILNLDKGIYKYKIELMSETKKLEVISLPNRSITQPLEFSNKVSVYDYLCQYVDMYSPLVKRKNGEGTWVYEKKYKVDVELKKVFGDVFAPDFSMDAPSLKDILSQLMITKDRIPMVKDDVIYSMDITERKGPFNNDPRYVNMVTGSLSSDNQADNLKRNYNNALAQDKSCRYVECLGFRNSSSALLTIENMRVETRNPLYKINKMHMCYYKHGKVYLPTYTPFVYWKKGMGTEYNGHFYKAKEDMEPSPDPDAQFDPSKWQDLGSIGSREKMFLCKQDITKLIKLNQEREALSKDWSDFEEFGEINNIDDLAQYKIATLGYSIDSNTITGWGEKYTYPKYIWDVTKTYIENIFEKVDFFSPYGDYDYNYLMENLLGLPYNTTFSFDNIIKNRVIPPEGTRGSLPLFFKSVFFLIDYNGFYNGSVIHSKDMGGDDITINDNASASLTLLEKDGLFQSEKINRYGNKGLQINARYTDISQLQELGTVYSNGVDDDVIIYHREYSIYDNVIDCQYYGTKNYVLKNYFTTVYAKYRTWKYLSYEESVNRAENKRMFILLSKDKQFYEYQNQVFNFEKFGDKSFLQLLFSGFNKNETLYDESNKINSGYFTAENNPEKYASDINAFVSGKSLCFNLKMFDNVSGGIYISDWAPEVNISVEDDFVGSVQKYYMLANTETGKINKMGFYVCNKDQSVLFESAAGDYDKDRIQDDIFPRLFDLPKLPEGEEDKYKEIVGNKFDVNLDNKEMMDMTFQFEPIVKDESVMFSQWMFKLTDLLATYNKLENDFIVKKYDDALKHSRALAGFYYPSSTAGAKLYFYILASNDVKALIQENNTINCNLELSWQANSDPLHEYKISIKCQKISTVNRDPGNPENIDDFDIIASQELYYWDEETQEQHTEFTTKTFNVTSNIVDSYIAKKPDLNYYFFETDEIFDIDIKDLIDDTTAINNLTITRTGIPEEDIRVSQFNVEMNQNIFDNELLPQNMYLLTSEEPLNKTLVYNEYEFKVWNYTTQYYKDENVWHNSKLYHCLADHISTYEFPDPESIEPRTVVIRIGTEIIREGEQSLRNCYVYQGAVNIDTELKYLDQTGVIVGMISAQEWIIRVPAQGAFVDSQGNNISTTTESPLYWTEIEPIIKNKNNEELTVTELKISDVFKIEQNDGSEYIKIDLTNIPSGQKSVQYWFYDNGSIKFVFGANISAEDKLNGYIKIYLSTLSTKNTKVYDNLNNVVGEIFNYVDQTAPIKFKPNGQLYRLSNYDNILKFEQDFEDDCSLIGVNDEYALSKPTISEIKIPEKYNNLIVRRIKTNAFSRLTALKTLRIPKTITRIGVNASSTCINLSEIYYEGTEEEWDNVIIDSGNEYIETANKHFGEY